MTDCEKMRMFIDDNYAMEYIIWENAIYNQLKNKKGSKKKGGNRKVAKKTGKKKKCPLDDLHSLFEGL